MEVDEKKLKAMADFHSHFITRDNILYEIKELEKEAKRKLKGTKGQDRYSIKQEYMYKINTLKNLLEKY